MKARKDQFGLKELIAIGIGGMIGGGIFSVLGLAVGMSGNAAPIAFLIAGCVALASGYSYTKLSLAFHSDGASFTYLEHAFPHVPNLAGILGWIVIVGYIGTLALYSYTFAVYAADLFGEANSVFIRITLSTIILLLFAVINLSGVKETGIAEDIAVYAKIVILFILGFIGFFTVKLHQYIPLFNKGHLSILSAAAIIFVAYEGFQLITNAVCETKDPNRNIPRAILLSIVTVTIIYFMLATMSVGNLSAADFKLHGEYAIAVAISPSLGKTGRILIDLSAILATSSAINATLFGSARMASEIAKEKLLPKAFSFRSRTNVPWVGIIIIALMSWGFTFTAPLEVIVTFSSLSFLIASFGVGVANARLHKKTKSKQWITITSLIFLLIVMLTLIDYMAVYQSKTLVIIIGLYIVIGIIELLFSKRRITREVR